jgi:hypothetical protein
MATFQEDGRKRVTIAPSACAVVAFPRARRDYCGIVAKSAKSARALSAFS